MFWRGNRSIHFHRSQRTVLAASLVFLHFVMDEAEKAYGSLASPCEPLPLCLSAV